MGRRLHKLTTGATSAAWDVEDIHALVTRRVLSPTNYDDLATDDIRGARHDDGRTTCISECVHYIASTMVNSINYPVTKRGGGMWETH